MGDKGKKLGYGYVVRNINSLMIGIFVHLFFDMSQVPKLKECQVWYIAGAQ